MFVVKTGTLVKVLVLTGTPTLTGTLILVVVGTVEERVTTGSLVVVEVKIFETDEVRQALWQRPT